jgi:phosphoribosylformimino-5-aminoimidazole carboxamide ribotide isomerase
VRIIPVIDVLNGIVVHAVGGRRHEYKPIVSQLTSSVEPVEVARALVSAFQPSEMYLADLDAIGGADLAVDLYRAILRLGVRLWVDAGVADAVMAMRVAEFGCDVVAGLETVPGPEKLSKIVAAVRPERTIFSLDLRDGEPLRKWPGDPIRAAIACGIKRLIVLDLARVGGGTGTGTEQLCQTIGSTYPEVKVFAGGGISGPDDLRRLEACGVEGTLVASALHDRRLRPEVHFRHS